MTAKRLVLLSLALAIIACGVVGWITYRTNREDYDAYRTLIQQGARVAGVEVGWHTPEEAQAKVTEWVAEPYYRSFTMFYEDEEVDVSPADDLGFHIPVDQMVGKAVAASHQYDYWQGFWLWLQGKAESLEIDVPLEMTFDRSAASRLMAGLSETYDIAAVEPMVDVQSLTFIPGRPGRRLDVDSATRQLNERVPFADQRELALPVTTVEPDQSQARIESMLATLGPVMESAPTPPSFFTATIPLSTTGGLAGTPLVSYTGELTWTFPYFASYTGHLTTTYGFFFDPGAPGARFDVQRAVRQVEAALRGGVATPITFEPDPVPQPPITKDLLLPPLTRRLADFPGVTSLLVKNLDTGEPVYESNVDHILSGMSIVKIGIMVEVYRHYGGTVDEETLKELQDMLGSESCNPCANRLLAVLGNGSAQTGAANVTKTMRRLGLDNFYLCAPFRVVEHWYGGQDEGLLVWTMDTASPLIADLWPVQSVTPGYDRCVRATPREMADLLEMIYGCTRDVGVLRETLPDLTPQTCTEMIDIMASNDLRNMLGAGIPAEVKLAHKHGFAGYDVPWGDTRAEVGIVFSPGATWLVSFYIWEDTPWIDFGVVQPMYRDVSNMLYNYFNPQEPFYPLPPWAPAPEETSAEGTS